MTHTHTKKKEIEAKEKRDRKNKDEIKDEMKFNKLYIMPFTPMHLKMWPQSSFSISSFFL